MRARPLRWLMPILVAALVPVPSHADDRPFAPGSLLVPMDTDYQDDGMFQAFGLVYQLLLADVRVYWIIRPDKEPGGVDVEVAAVDVATEALVTDDGDDGPTGRHAYRGGPFVIDDADAETALVLITAWQAEHETAVHEATEAFVAPVSRTLTVAPNIAVFADGNEDIAFSYLNAAGLPDSLGQAWPEHKDGSALYPDYPDVLNVAEVRGPTDSNDADGALFDEQGLPVYCQIMTMHWGVNERDDEAIAEFRAFLQYPTHFMAECQAVNAVENSINGRFLTPNGYLIGDRPDEVEQITAYLPFGQLDGDFDTVGGSEPAYSLPEGDSYYDQNVVFLTEAGSGIGVNDVWMTGFFGGACRIDPKNPEEAVCERLVGKVSYLGGHRYSTDTPISDNPDAQGTRLFLNSLFEADCVTTVGQPSPRVVLTGPSVSRAPDLDLEVSVGNDGPGIALDPVLVVTLPAGLAYVDAVPTPTSVEAGVVTWELPNLGPDSTESLGLAVLASAVGDYQVRGRIDYRVGQNTRSTAAEPLFVRYDPNASLPGDESGLDGGGADGGADAGSDLAGDGQDASVGGDDGQSDGGVGGDGGADGADGSGGGSQGGTAEEGCGCASASGAEGGPVLAVVIGLALVAARRRKR